MRKWYKFEPVHNTPTNKTESIDQSFHQHAQAMGGYEINEAYESSDSLFKKFYYKVHYERYENYFRFIEKNVKKTATILSIGSGRAIVELYMREHGYDKITCSDLMPIECIRAIKMPFIKLNILETQAPKKFDVIICLSVIYLFNNKELEIFFKNVHKSLNQNGLLILDSAGSTDSFFTHLYHEYYLYFEAIFLCILNTLRTGEKYSIKTKHFGFRRENGEIIQMAKKCGFDFCGQENYNFETELTRSSIYLKLVKSLNFIEKPAIQLFGVRMPYVRMFKFQTR